MNHSHYAYHNFSRHEIASNSTMMPGSPVYAINPNHPCPAPSHFPTRPASSRTGSPIAFASYIHPQQDMNPKRQLALQQMARIIPAQQQQNLYSLCQKKPRNLSQEKRKRTFSEYTPSNKLTTVEGMEHLQNNEAQKQEKISIKSPFLNFGQQGSCQEGFNFEHHSYVDNSMKQTKTDKNQPQQQRFPDKPVTPEAKGFPGHPSYFKTKTYKELDSTINSSFNNPDLIIQHKQKLDQTTLTRDSDTLTAPSFISKKNSPTNLWPLSISPSQQKRQILPNELFIKKSDKTIPSTQDTCTEFKKKNHFQFLRNLKRKTSISNNLHFKSFTIQDFDILDKIGKGAFGDVFLAQERMTGFVVVLKKLQKKKIREKKLQEQLIRQIKIQSFLDHKHLTSLYGFFSDDTSIYLILQLMPDGSLMQARRKRKISQPQASFYIRQVCLGLKYMHTEKVIHRDIKPQNIFLNDTYAKIGDFGCSIFTETNRNTQIGSFAYISPEQLKCESYNKKIDVWSVGVITYEMLCGTSPFQADILAILKQQKTPELSQLNFPNNIDLSHEAKNFLVQMLDPNPQERLSIDEALRHQFIQKYIRSESEGSTAHHHHL